jgi:hypothetical protein
MRLCPNMHMDRVAKLTWRGDVERYGEALPLTEDAGDYVIVKRGAVRSLVMRCPDRCGDLITVNLDPRSGKAWRIDRKNEKLTLYPSVWRNEGCRAHFIVWRDLVLWCDGRWRQPVQSDALIDGVATVLGEHDAPMHYETLAERCEIHPWDALWACHSLIRRGLAKEVERSIFRILRGHAR